MKRPSISSTASRLLQEHVAPHHRVRARDPREVGEAAGGVAQHLRLQVLLEIGDRADDGIGDQMRQMRGDREHPVVVLGRHGLDQHADGAPERCDLGDRRPDRCPRAASGCSGGRGTARRTRHPGRNARCRRPDGRRPSGRARGRCRRSVADDIGLDRADVGDDRVRREAGRHRLGDRADRSRAACRSRPDRRRRPRRPGRSWSDRQGPAPWRARASPRAGRRRRSRRPARARAG